MTSMAFTTADPVALAKALIAYAKTNPAFTFKAGFVEGRAIDIKSIKDLATHAFERRADREGDVPDQLVRAALAVSLNGVARNLAVVIERGDQGRQVPARLRFRRAAMRVAVRAGET